MLEPIQQKQVTEDADHQDQDEVDLKMLFLLPIRHTFYLNPNRSVYERYWNPEGNKAKRKKKSPLFQDLHCKSW